MSQKKGLQRTAPDGLGALESTQSTRSLCLPPTTFLFLWLWNEIHFVGVEGTHNNMIFDQNVQHNISFEKVAEDNTRWFGCTSIYIEYQIIVHKNNEMIFEQKRTQNISFERVADDNTRWFGCTSIYIKYQIIVFASYNFSVPVIAE